MLGIGAGKRNPVDQLPQWVSGAQSPREPWKVIEPHRDGPLGGERVGLFIFQPMNHWWKAAGAGAVLSASGCGFGRSPWYRVIKGLRMCGSLLVSTKTGYLFWALPLGAS